MARKVDLPLLPIKGGIDNIHAGRSSVFSPGQGESGAFESPAFVLRATDVDVKEDGRVSCRDGVSPTPLYSASAGRRMFVVGESCYVQDGATFLRLGSPAPTTLLTGLDTEKDVLLHEWPLGSGRVYANCGDEHYRIQGNTVKRWGLPVPTVLGQAALAGALTHGTYLASIAYRDGPGTDATAQEGGAMAPVAFTISTGTGKRLTAPIADTGVTHVSFYLSRPDQAELFRIAIVAVGTIAETGARGAALNIAAVTRSTWSSVPMMGLNWAGPVADLTAIGSMQAFMLVGKGNAVYRSWPGRPELYKPGEAMQLFPANVTDIVGLPGGFFVGTEAGLYWVEGEDPTKWRRTKVMDGNVTPKGIVIRGQELPPLEKIGFGGYDGMAALMVVERKIVAGMPGKVMVLLDDQYRLGEADRYSMCLGDKRLFVAGV